MKEVIKNNKLSSLSYLNDNKLLDPHLDFDNY